MKHSVNVFEPSTWHIDDGVDALVFGGNSQSVSKLGSVLVATDRLSGSTGSVRKVLISVNAAVASLGCLASLDNLQVLHIYAAAIEDAESIAGLTKLRNLHLSLRSYSPELLNSLRRLKIVDLSLASPPTWALERAPHIGSIRRLKVTSWPTAWVQNLCPTQLKTLIITGGKLAEISKLECPDLENIWLADLPKLSKVDVESVSTAIIENCKGVTVGSLSALPKLERFRLSNLGSLEDVSELRNHAKLRHICMDAGSVRIGRLFLDTLHHIRKLHMRTATNETVHELSMSFPNVRISNVSVMEIGGVRSPVDADQWAIYV